METASAQPERRFVPRHRMSLPVRYPGGTGVTRDVSSTGVYFLSGGSFEEGQQVSLAISLEHSNPEGPLDVTYRGVVVRLEESDLGTGALPLRGVAIAGDADVLGITAMSANGVGILPVGQAHTGKGHQETMPEGVHVVQLYTTRVPDFRPHGGLLMSTGGLSVSYWSRPPLGSH